jgi:tRNA-2-methylthio-N6-dimethylallyladenosine synthase
VAERYERLAALVAELSWQENQKLIGRPVEVLVADGEGRKDSATHRMSGRARDNRLVHFTPADEIPRPGDMITTVVTSAAPHYLLADDPPKTVRRTRGGDAWDLRRASQEVADSGRGGSTPAAAAADFGTGGSATGGSVLLGMPSRRPPR